ncbi:hypothetical protein G2W53_001292 [Senna tora]|uniref:Uncharacterized protein n=1 Tax=Senna tora TaxID=362788 RepID=A0A834XHL9_9FABA|nr:hypothetical protein G2W53_001292 [Senna tora]
MPVIYLQWERLPEMQPRPMAPNKDLAVYGYGNLRWRDRMEEWKKKQGDKLQVVKHEGGGNFGDQLDGPEFPIENTKSVLVATCFVHLRYKKYAKFTTDLTTINPRILLSGPTGSEIYQEMLAKALANYFKAKLLIFDSHLLLGGLSSKEAELLNNGSNAEKSCSCTELSLTATDLGRSMDPSTSETEMPSSSNAPTQFGLESQHKLETYIVPSTSGAIRNCLFKLGISSSISSIFKKL